MKCEKSNPKKSASLTGVRKLTSPQLLRFANGGWQELDVGIGSDKLQSRQTSQGGEEELLILLPFDERVHLSELHAGVDMILDQATQWRPIRRHYELLIGRCDEMRLRHGQIALWEVAVHFVTIIVCIVGVAV